MTDFQKGIMLALGTALISGIAGFIAKIGVAVADPLIHTSLRVLLVSTVLTVLVLRKKKLKKLPKLSKKTLLKLCFIGVIGGSIPFILFFTGLSKTTALNAALIHKTLYLWVALFSITILKEKITIRQILGFSIIFWANLVIFKGGGFSFGPGEIMILAATIFWALENVIAKTVLPKVEPLLVAWARLTVGSLIILTFTLSTGRGKLFLELNPAQILTILGGATTLLLYVLAWYSALRLLPATLTAVLLTPATLVTNLITAVFITQSLPLPQLQHLGGLTIGVLLVLIYSQKFDASKNLSKPL